MHIDIARTILSPHAIAVNPQWLSQPNTLHGCTHGPVFENIPPGCEPFFRRFGSSLKRLQGSFGLFWGVNVPDKLTDDLLPDELPYIELFYKYTNAGYTVTHHHHHTGGERPEVRIISPLDERSDNALAKAEKYRSNAWWLVEKRQREAQ